jgi:hypothetical protein
MFLLGFGEFRVTRADHAQLQPWKTPGDEHHGKKKIENIKEKNYV